MQSYIFNTYLTTFSIFFFKNLLFHVNLIPEASEGEHSNLSTIGFAIGFVLMMVLDVVMG